VNIKLHEVLSKLQPGKVRLLQVAEDLETGRSWVVRSDDLWRESLIALGKFARAHQAAARSVIEDDPPTETLASVASAVDAWNRSHPIIDSPSFAGRMVKDAADEQPVNRRQGRRRDTDGRSPTFP
jgi:hypothetical protein